MPSAYGDRLQAQEASDQPAEPYEAKDGFALDTGEPIVDELQPGLYYRVQPDARGGIVVTEVLRRRAADGRRVVLSRYVSGARSHGRSCTCGLWRRAGTCYHIDSVEWAFAEVARTRPLPLSVREVDRHLYVCGACGGDASTGWQRGAMLLCTSCLEERRLRERPVAERQREREFCARCRRLVAGLVDLVGTRYCTACAEEVSVYLPRLVSQLYRKIEACERFSRRCLRRTGRRSHEADAYTSDLWRALAKVRPQATEQLKRQLLKRLEARKQDPPVAAPGRPMGEVTPVAFEGVPAAS